MLRRSSPAAVWVAPRRRLRRLALSAAAFMYVALATGGAQAQALNDDELLAAMIITVIAHDAGIPLGLLPFPVAQLVAEAIQFAGNLTLKGYRPWLQAPPNIAVYPFEDDEDSCSYRFELPNTTASYENMFGIIPIKPHYRDPVNNITYSWDDRWGLLGPPEIYHANSTARVSVFSPTPVRRFNETEGRFEYFAVPFTDPVQQSEYYYPILDAYDPPPSPPRILGKTQALKVDRDGHPKQDGPQWVYFPIGAHTLVWTAATQLNTLTDVLVPAILLAFTIHSEAKTARGGLNAAKKIDGGFDPKTAKGTKADELDAQAGKRKFNSRWEALFTRKKPGPIGEQVRAEAAKKFRDEILGILDKLVSLGVSRLELETGAYLKSRGDIDDRERKWIDMFYKAAIKSKIETGIETIKFIAQGDDAKGNKFIVNVIVALLQTFGLDEFVTFDTGVTFAAQQFIVWDNVPPTLVIDPAPLILEATDFGGTRRYRAIDAMRAVAIAGASDNCGRMPELSNDAPELLELGQTIVTWTARDKGPNPNDGQDYAPPATQTIIVQDTQPPLLLAPPSKVIEATTDLTRAEADIGNAVAVDLADVQPAIANNAPAQFPLDQRTAVQWTATDKSGNAAQESQLITVKTTGTNTQPVADDAVATTLTAEPVDIRLTATDFDELDGVFDPLWFKIESQPQKGEFIAPLYPFFINDYRTKPGDGLGDSYDPTSDNLYSFIIANFCQKDFAVRTPPKNFVHEALFVHVTDDGIRYVLDSFFVCDPFDDRTQTKPRISKWTAAGDYLGQMRIGATPDDEPVGDTFVLDRDGFLYYNIQSEPGSSSNALHLQKCTTDWGDRRDKDGNPDTDTSLECLRSQKFDGGSANGALDASRLAYARVDSRKDVAYVADASSIFAFELLDTGGSRYLGELGPKDNGAVIDDWFGKTPALEVGSDGSLYVADENHHRIHKIAPITVDDKGEYMLGDYVGWAGRCTGSGNKACDDALGRSRGYSCTFAPDSCKPTLAELKTSAGRALASGAGQGQFDTPKYIAIDPNDVLYIADYGNERVQRLSPDGSFAGEAVSDGSGINKGDRPSFVLGNMGKPESVSVNSSQFYVVDRDEQFVHVYGTLPFKDITGDAATVTYVSDQDFPNPNNSGIDTFTYSVSDGLVQSEPATVSVTVNRNFRPPVALAGKFTTDEDTPLDFTLPADDPDGIKGKDFLGLDTLTYTIMAQPQHGTLSGSGAKRTYTPDADYYGEDALRFKVNDSRDDSGEATVIITVTPVNDPPVLTIEVPQRVALGFPTLVTSTFTDDPSDGYEAGAAWGDGQFDAKGGFSDDDGDNPRIEGVAISAPPMPEIEGRTFAQHVYETPGARTVQVCVTDSGQLPGCDSTQITVEPLINLGIGGSVYAEPLADDEITQQQIDDDEDFTYELTIVNEKPSVGTGLTAAAVVLEFELPAGLAYGVIEISRGTCRLDGSALVCALGDLEPGAEVTVTIEAFGPGNLIYNDDFDIEGLLKTLSPALEKELEFIVSVELVSDTVDSDGDDMTDAYETAYRLDPTQDDAGGDFDGDGLDNLREFELGTSPLDTDSDGDGLSDFDEDADGITDPTKADSDDDGMPDGWELDNGLDPAFAGDGDEDGDGDGLTNVAEFENDSDPQRKDFLPELVIPPVLMLLLSETS